MARVRDLGLLEKVYILAGIGPMASARSASWIRDNVPGIHIPDAIIERLLGAGKKQKVEGRNICVELIGVILPLSVILDLFVSTHS